MKTRVVHCKKEKYDIYIGRPSDWGNPFALKEGYTRDEAICEYSRWILTRPGILRKIPELRGKVLGCWCSPKACHGDVLAELCELSDKELAELIKSAKKMGEMRGSDGK